MKIAYFNYMADLYGYSIGSTVKAIKLFGAFEHLGHAVSFHWLAKQNQLDLSNAGGEPSQRLSLLRDLLFTPKQLLKNVLQLLREIKILHRERPDALIVRLDAFRISAVWAARLYHLPLIVEADGACSYEWLTFNNGRHVWNWALLWCERYVLANANGIFTQSQEAKKYYLKRHPLVSDSIQVITNGADVFEKKNSAIKRADLGIPEKSRVIGFLGSMHHWHGVADVPQLIGNVLDKFNDVVFLFVGKGGALEEDLRQSLTGQFEGRVLFTGRVDMEVAQDYVDLFTIAIAPYPKIDLFYFSPMKVFEYMAVGKAIIASRSGQIERVLKDGKSALLYDPGNISQLEKKIVTLLQDDALRERLGAAARREFLNHYTWNHKAQELDDYLSHVLSTKAS